MTMLGKLLLFALDIYLWIIVLSVVISWLMAFEVINAKSEQARNLLRLLAKATDPVFKPLRKYVPPIGGIDITPIIIVFAIFLAKELVVKMFFHGPSIVMM